MNLKTLTSGKSSFDVGLEMFEKFVSEVFSGGDGEQKAKLQEKWESLTRSSVSLEEGTKNRTIETLDSTNYGNVTLPYELWMKIMIYLKTEDMFGSVALVSKHFNSLTHDSSLIKYLHVRNIRLTELDYQAYFVKDLDPNIMNAAENTKYSKVKRVILQAKQLTELSIDFCDDALMDMLVVQALHLNQNLNSLKINTEQKSTFCNDKFIPRRTIGGLFTSFYKEILKNSHIKLEMLEFYETYIEPKVMVELCKIKTLTSIKVYSQKFMTFTHEVLHTLATADNKLQTLVIDDKNICDQQINETKTALNHLLDEKKETLKCLKISGFHWKCCDNPCLNLNFTQCQNLEEFDGGNLCSHDRRLISNLPSNLKKLRLAKPITNGPVMQLNLPHLTHLSLICDGSIEFSKYHYLTSNEFPSLQRLHLYVDSTKDKILSLDVFEKLLQNCPRLKSVQIYGDMYLDVSDEYLYKTFKDANVFVVQNSLVGNDILRRSQKSFEEFLLQEDPPMLIKYLKMKQNAKNWRANLKHTQRRFS